jgi:predicted RNA binding protein YcfA (HicA-like mRNA interferase family)
MKRHKLIRHLEQNGCRFLREGANHTVYFNPACRKCSTVPRHREVLDFVARRICRDLEIPTP